MTMMPLTAAFIVGNRAVWDQAQACIRNLPVRIVVEQNEPADADALLDRIERHRVDVVLVETGLVSMALEEFIRRLKNTSTQPAVFVLHPDAAPELILVALRAGANEYLYPPLAETLRDAFERLAATRTRNAAGGAGGLGRIFGFLSARGGCGATTIVIHTATELARQMKQPLLLADFDFDAGLLRFLMKPKNTYSVRDALDNLHRMDLRLWKGLVSSHANSMDFIPSPEELAAKCVPGREEVTHLMRFLRSIYPVTVVDFGRSVNMPALDSMPELDLLYVVTTPDPAALAHARRAVRMTEERGFANARVKVLLNRVPDKAAVDLHHIEDTLGCSCVATFRNDFMALYDAWSEGHLLDPGTPLGKQMRQLAGSIKARVTGEREEETEVKAARALPESGKRWFSFFQRAQA